MATLDTVEATLDTVKKHVGHVLGKLGAATDRGRGPGPELSLIP